MPAEQPVDSVIILKGKVKPEAIPTRFIAHIAPKPCSAVRTIHFIGRFDLKAKINVVNTIKTKESITIVLTPTDIRKPLKNILTKVYKKLRTNIPIIKKNICPY